MRSIDVDPEALEAVAAASAHVYKQAIATSKLR